MRWYMQSYAPMVADNPIAFASLCARITPAYCISHWRKPLAFFIVFMPFHATMFFVLELCHWR